MDRNWTISERKPGHGQHAACIQSGNLTRTNMKLRGIRDTCKRRVVQSFPGSGGCERSVLSAFSHKCCFSKKAPRVLLPPRGGWPSNLGNTCRPCETQRVTVEMRHRRNSFHCDRLRGRLANIGRVGQPGQRTTGSMEGLSTDQLWSRYQETFRRIMGLRSCKLRRQSSALLLHVQRDPLTE